MAGERFVWRNVERKVVGLLACAIVCCGSTGASRAQDTDPALDAFQAHSRATKRGPPVDAIEWDERLRAPGQAGPQTLRSADIALLAAVRGARWDEALELVKRGRANPNARDERRAHALVPAARAGRDELVGQLIKHGAELDRSGEDGFTALGAAAFAGRRSTVRLLIRAGADPRRFGASGQTALHLAALAGQQDVIVEMLRLQVDIEQLNRQRETALDVAAAAGQQETMARLLDAGADASQAGQR